MGAGEWTYDPEKHTLQSENSNSPLGVSSALSATSAVRFDLGSFVFLCGLCGKTVLVVALPRRNYHPKDAH